MTEPGCRDRRRLSLGGGRGCTARWRSDERGSVALLFGLLLVPIVFLIGAVVDYSRASHLRTVVSAAADMAAIMAVNEAKAQIAAGKGEKAALAAGRKAGVAAYNGVLPPGVSTQNPAVDMVRVGPAITATLTHEATSSNVFAGVLGLSGIDIGVRAAATTSLDPYVDVALLVDVSGSMAIGADDAAIATLRANLNGCAFACHDGVKVKGTNMDAYQWAVSQGIKLRTHALNDGITEFLDYLKQNDPNGVRNRVAMFSFSDDLTRLTNYSSNLDQAKANLPTQTDAAGELTAATHFKQIMPAFTLQVGLSGDGGTQLTAKKLVVIATDGVEDPNRTWSTSAPWLQIAVTPFDAASCAALKLAGVSVGVIHTPYVPMPWDWGYNATLGMPSLIGGPGKRADDVAGQLRKCASPGLYAVASATDIGSKFKDIFMAFTQTRITQ